MQKQNLCQGDFMPKNRQHYRKIKYPDKVTKQNALYLSGYFYLVLWEVEMLISRQPSSFWVNLSLPPQRSPWRICTFSESTHRIPHRYLTYIQSTKPKDNRSEPYRRRAFYTPSR